VSQETTQIFVSAVLSACLALFVYRLARRQRLSFRYTIGWLALCALGMFAGLFIPVVEPLSNFLQLSPAGLIAVGALSVLVLICIQLSASISGLQEQIRKLAEQIAHLRDASDRLSSQSTNEGKDA
jgi:hypothetical protein